MKISFRLAALFLALFAPLAVLADAYPTANGGPSNGVVPECINSSGQAVANSASCPMYVSGGSSSGGNTVAPTNAGTSATTANPVQGVTGGVPVPVSATALPLPNGAATSALQSSTQAAPGSSSSAATGVQGVTGGVPIAISGNVGSTPTDVAIGTGTITTQDTGTTTVAGQLGQSQVTGTPTTGSSLTYSLSGLETLAVQFSGTWTGNIVYETSIDGGVTYTPSSGRIKGTTYAPITAFTSNGTALIAISPYTTIRFRATTAITGTATLTVRGSPNTHDVDILGPVRTVSGDGTNNLLTVTAPSTAVAATVPAVAVGLSPNSPLPDTATGALAAIKTSTATDAYNNAPFTSNTPMTAGTTYTAGRSVLYTCTVAGTVTETLAGGTAGSSTTLSRTLVVGQQQLPDSITAWAAGTATCGTVVNLY